MKYRRHKFIFPLYGALCGSLMLTCLSAIQKIQIGVPIQLCGFVVPFWVGGIAGYLLILWNVRIRILNEELESKVAERTDQLKNLNQVLEKNNFRYNAIFENMGCGAVMFEPQNDGQEFLIAEFNRAAEKIENISRKEVVGREVREVFPGITDFGLFDVLQRVYATGEAEHFSAGEYKDDRVEGWRENFTYKLPSNEVVTIYNDVTDRKRMEDELKRFASTDFLTGIPNRRQLVKTLERELHRAQRYGRTLSFLMFDLDHFKFINDRCGHEAGDKVLQIVAKSCENTLRNVDEVGRIGGEEFAVILPDTQSEGALEVAERLRSLVENLVIATKSGDVSVTISIGVAEFSYGKTDLARLMRKADDALYVAKREGRNRIVVATEAEQQRSC